MHHFEKDFSELPRWAQISVAAPVIIGFAFMAEVEGNIPVVSAPLKAARFIVKTIA